MIRHRIVRCETGEVAEARHFWRAAFRDPRADHRSIKPPSTNSSAPVE
jgi:hypothetical protein